MCGECEISGQCPLTQPSCSAASWSPESPAQWRASWRRGRSGECQLRSSRCHHHSQDDHRLAGQVVCCRQLLSGLHVHGGDLPDCHQVRSEECPDCPADPHWCRQTAIGSCSMVARIGGIAAPYIALYLPTIDWTFAKKLPMLIMGISSILGGLLAFCLPETLGSSLPEKMDDVKEMKKNAKPLCSCVNPKTLP